MRLQTAKRPQSRYARPPRPPRDWLSLRIGSIRSHQHISKRIAQTFPNFISSSSDNRVRADSRKQCDLRHLEAEVGGLPDSVLTRHSPPRAQRLLMAKSAYPPRWLNAAFIPACRTWQLATTAAAHALYKALNSMGDQHGNCQQCIHHQLRNKSDCDRKHRSSCEHLGDARPGSRWKAGP